MGAVQGVNQSNPTRKAAPPVGPKAAPAKKKAPPATLGKDHLELTSQNASPVEARQKADAMWVRSFVTPGSLTGFRTIERSFNDIKTDTVYWMERDAFAQSKANSKLEAEALAKLTPEQAAAFQRVSQPFNKDTEGNARLALQVLLLEGKLTDARVATDGGDLLTQFDRLITMPLVPEIDRTRLIAQLLREVAEPAAMSQQNKKTCTVSAIAILTAMERPAEYVRIVGALATPEGKVTLKSGAVVERLPGTEANEESPRSLPMRLWAPAFMNFASEAKPYDNTKDEFPNGSAGLSQDRFSQAVKALGDADPTLLKVSGSSADEVIAQIQTATEAGKPTLASLAWGEADSSGAVHTYHEIVVTRVTADRVYYANPWGSEESMGRDEFKTRLYDATLASLGPLAP